MMTLIMVQLRRPVKLQSAAETDRIVEETLPALAEHFQAMAVVARDTSQALLDPPKTLLPAEGARGPDGPRPLLETLVLEGLRLAEEEEPLRRADACSAVAELLVQKILLTAAREQMHQASTLGKCLGELVDRGVTSNLNRAQVDEADAERLAERERIRRRVAAASAVLQTNLQRAPPPARAGLQRAMEASRKGLERAAQAGQGKGKSKPNRKNGHPPKVRPTLPPGLEKKRDKGRHGPAEQETQVREQLRTRPRLLASGAAASSGDALQRRGRHRKVTFFV